MIEQLPLEEWEWAFIRPYLAPHWRNVFELMWEVGLRITEALALEKQDVAEHGIWVKTLKTKQENPPKTFVPVRREFRTRLRTYMVSSKKKHLRHKTLIFPFTRQAANHALKQAVDKAGTRKTIHPHSFRHGFAKRIRNLQGYSPVEHRVIIQALMRHGSIRSAEQYFTPGPGDVSIAWGRVNPEG